MNSDDALFGACGPPLPIDGVCGPQRPNTGVAEWRFRRLKAVTAVVGDRGQGKMEWCPSPAATST